MATDLLSSLDFARRDDPSPQADVHASLLDWLAYQRHEFRRKWRDLSPLQLTSWSVPPLELSVLGLIRHMQQMEHHYLTWGLGGGERVAAYGEDDYAGGSLETVEADVRLYLEEVERADAAIAVMAGLDSPGRGSAAPLSHVLVKMIDEYALHSGQAHMLRFAALGRVQR
ncbi:DUF664 domain-containing protein [Agrococcus sp. DT81.2]|uniref:mycothiol transferase n=1 Tax=Agrococcus sp. DT81.2 TaxID=3393414 RepID=UPI003CE46F5D